MGENLAERLAELEQAVRRAAEAIGRMRRERDGLRARVTALEANQEELQRLKREHKEVLSQVDSILKELDRLDL